MATKKEQPFPRKAASVIPTSAAGAAASPSSFLSPLLDRILSPFHISRATFNFAYGFEILGSSLLLHVNFWMRKVYKFHNVLISWITSFSVYRCMCSRAFLFSGWPGCPLCSVLLAADVRLSLWSVAVSIPLAAVTKHRFWQYLHLYHLYCVYSCILKPVQETKENHLVPRSLKRSTWVIRQWKVLPCDPPRENQLERWNVVILKNASLPQ